MILLYNLLVLHIKVEQLLWYINSRGWNGLVLNVGNQKILTYL